MMLKKEIIYFGGACILFCDGKCNKAWGINLRKEDQLSDNPDDFEYLADYELGEAPEDPMTYEGGHAKPFATNGDKLNKWCCRECERSSMIQMSEVNDDTDFNVLLKNFSKRVKNIRSNNG